MNKEKNHEPSCMISQHQDIPCALGGHCDAPCSCTPQGTDYTGPMPDTFNERNFRRGYLNGYEQGVRDALEAGPKDRTKLEGHDVEWKDTVSRTMNEINRKWRAAINSLLANKPEK